MHSHNAREHIAEAVDAVQREQALDVVHIFAVQLGQRFLHHALCETCLLLQPRAELPVFVCGSGAGRLDRRLVLLLARREGRGYPQPCRGQNPTLRLAPHVEVSGDDGYRWLQREGP